MIHLKADFFVDVITQINSAPNNIYPGGIRSEGVGISTTGRYITKERNVHGYFNYNLTTNSLSKNGYINGLGQMYFSLINKEDYQYYNIKFYVDFNNKTRNGDDVFSVIQLDGFITKAKVNNKPYFGNIKFKPIDNGKKYRIYIDLEPLEPEEQSSSESEQKEQPTYNFDFKPKLFNGELPL